MFGKDERRGNEYPTECPFVMYLATDIAARLVVCGPHQFSGMYSCGCIATTTGGNEDYTR